MDAGLSGSSFHWNGRKPVPLDSRGRAEARTPRGLDTMGGYTTSGEPHFRSGVAERNGDEARPLRRLHPHQYGLPAARLRVGHRLAHVGRGRDRLAVDGENAVAGLEAVAGGAVGIDLGHHDAFAAIS